jgi:hypothetical protein
MFLVRDELNFLFHMPFKIKVALSLNDINLSFCNNEIYCFMR